MKKLSFFIIIISLFLNTKAQTKVSADSYIKNSIDGYIHLFYDQQYYLVDENCPFKTYTRVTKFDKEKGGVYGFFTDYYNNGAVYLTGNYTEGKKDGNFKAYYPSGKPKYSINFKDNKETGVWEYYYPSGNLWYQIEFKNNITYLNQYINEYGQAKIKLGKGKYSFKQEAIGFNDIGYTAIIYEGRIKNGLPKGVWSTFLTYQDNKKELIGTELFNKGVFIDSYYFFPKVLPPNSSLVKLYPNFFEDNALSLIYKNCTIDDNQGFNLYLQNELNNALSMFIIAENISPQTYTVAATINERGNISKITLPDDLSSALKSFTKKTLENINYWIPSFKDGKTIADTLKIKIELNFNEKEEPFFGYPTIIRENGQ